MLLILIFIIIYGYYIHMFYASIFIKSLQKKKKSFVFFLGSITCNMYTHDNHCKRAPSHHRERIPHGFYVFHSKIYKQINIIIIVLQLLFLSDKTYLLFIFLFIFFFHYAYQTDPMIISYIRI